MKRKILIVGASFGAQDAVSGIMTDLAAYTPADTELYFCGFNKEKQQNAHNIYLPIPNFKSEIKRKICTALQIDTCTQNSDIILNHLQKYSHLKFDLVIAVGGVFSFIEAAYIFATENKTPLKIVYFDPFSNNLFTKNPQKRQTIEKRWLAYADNLYFNADNNCPDYLKKNPKVKLFYIPLFLRPVQTCTPNSTLIYGGTFYRRIRKPKLLYNFACTVANKGFKIQCYSTLKHYPKNTGIDFYPILNRADFEKRCQAAQALIYIGNAGGDAQSSKYLEYIALRKPVIGVNVEANNEVRKYKFYLDEKDPQLPQKLNTIKQEELLAYNPFDDFPHRMPQVLADMLF